jgi:membrane protease YdiL (CAAX protease family)
MHWDMPGGQGIIRVTAGTCLGLACGVARQATGSIVVPIAIHMLFNALGLAGARRIIVNDTFPTFYMVPTLATALGLLGGAIAIVVAIVLSKRSRTVDGPGRTTSR